MKRNRVPPIPFIPSVPAPLPARNREPLPLMDAESGDEDTKTCDSGDNQENHRG